MTNQLSQLTDTIGAVFQQMQQWPAAVLLCIVLLILGTVWKSIPTLDNKYIPIFILAAGGVLNYFIGDMGSVRETQRNPNLILVLWGIVVGFVAWAFHATVLKRLEKWLPFLSVEKEEP